MSASLLGPAPINSQALEQRERAGVRATAYSGATRPLGADLMGDPLSAGVMRDPLRGGGQVGAAKPSLPPIKTGGGASLPAKLLARMNGSLNHNFGHVRIHTGAEADQAAEQVQARAFTIGTQIWFKQGLYAPGTRAGDELLMHELVHVKQHDEGRLPSTMNGKVSSPTDPHEREAQHIARSKVAGGAPVTPSGSPDSAQNRPTKTTASQAIGRSCLSRSPSTTADMGDAGVGAEDDGGGGADDEGLMSDDRADQSQPVNRAAHDPQQAMQANTPYTRRRGGLWRSMANEGEDGGSARAARRKWRRKVRAGRRNYRTAKKYVYRRYRDVRKMGRPVKALYRAAKSDMRNIWKEYRSDANKLWDNIKSSYASSQEKESATEQGMSALNTALDGALDQRKNTYVRALAFVQPDLNKGDAHGQQTETDPLYVKGNGDSRALDPNDVDQNHLGDCWLMAAIAAIVRKDPALIRRIIKDRHDGTYEVTFYKGQRREKKVFVDAAFPVDVKGNAVYAGAGDGELWVRILEKAYAKWKGGYRGIVGGYPEDAMEALTGQSAQSYRIRRFSEKRLLTKLRDAQDADAALTAYTPSFSNSMTADAKEIPVYANHAYAVASVNDGARNIDLQNPWGHTHITGLSISKFKKFFHAIQIL